MNANQQPEYNQAQKDLAGLLQRAAPYRGQPWKFNRLLATAGGITQKDLAALEDTHARASHHHRVVSLDAAREKRNLAKLAVTKPQPLPALHTPDIQVPEPPRQTDTPPSPEDTAARLKRVLQTTKRPRAQDPAGRYLKHHALNLANAANLRFHPGAPVNQDGKTIELPALLAPVRTPDGTLEAVHHIYLTPDGDPAPIEPQQHTSGSPHAGAVWLFNPAKAERVVLCENIEDALTLSRILPIAATEHVAIGATLSAARAPDVELPITTRELLFIHTKDDAGEAAWQALRTRHANNPTLSLSLLSARRQDINTQWINTPNTLTATLLPHLDATPWHKTYRQLLGDNTHHIIARPIPGVTAADRLSNYADIIERTRSLLINLKYQHGRAATNAIAELNLIISRHEDRHTDWFNRADYLIEDHARFTARAHTSSATPYYLPGYQPFINSVHRHMDDLNLLLIADTHALPTKLRDIIAEHDALKTVVETISTYADTVETHTRTHKRLTRTDALHTRNDLQAKYPEWLREADQLVATGKKLLKSTDPTYRALLNDRRLGNHIRRAVDSLDNVIRPPDQHRVPAKQRQRRKHATLTKQQSPAKKTQKRIDERPEHDISHGPEIDL